MMVGFFGKARGSRLSSVDHRYMRIYIYIYIAERPYEWCTTAFPKISGFWYVKSCTTCIIMFVAFALSWRNSVALSRPAPLGFSEV